MYVASFLSLPCRPPVRLTKRLLAVPDVSVLQQVNGLVHISQLADEFVANCDEHVKEGDMVRLFLLDSRV